MILYPYATLFPILVTLWSAILVILMTFLMLSRFSIGMLKCVLQTFSQCSPVIRTLLMETYCMSLSGAVSWNLCCKQLESLEIAFNNILRKTWNLPRETHLRLLYHVAGVSSIFNIIKRSYNFLRQACVSDSPLIISLIIVMVKFTPH